VGSYSIGKEKVYTAISKAFGQKIYVSDEKLKVTIMNALVSPRTIDGN
jgi:hypothetical protein